MKQYLLKNKQLTATLKAEGAELMSLKKIDTEYIWNGNPEYWNRHTPVLFPFVGGLVEKKYSYNQQDYSLGQHGFARDCVFDVIEKSDDKIVFELHQNKDTLNVYPFDFKLQIIYTLTEDSLTTAYKVSNPSDKIMYFSIGGHPAYACPFKPEHKREDYQLVFNNNEQPQCQLLENGLRTDSYKKVFTEAGKLDISKNIFDDDALIFNPNPFEKVSFVHKSTDKTYLTVSFKNFPYLGIWSKNAEAPFVCIEPWHGIADHKNHNQKLEDKEGIITLQPNDTFDCEYIVTL